MKQQNREEILLSGFLPVASLVLAVLYAANEITAHNRKHLRNVGSEV